jgi:hypothetical protein
MTKTRWIASGLALSCVLLAVITIFGCSRDEERPEALGLDLRSSSLPGGGHPFALVAKDLNRDGKVDLAVTNPKLSRISIYLGRGDGSFEPPAHFATGRRPRGIVAEDFDEDGLLDLAVASTGQNSVAVHLGFGDGRFRKAKAFPARAPVHAGAGGFEPGWPSGPRARERGRAG